MKKQILVLLAMIGFLVSSCKEDELNILIPYFGNAKAIKNGKKWTSDIYALTSHDSQNHLVISLNVHNKQGFRRETIFFAGIEKKIGRTDLKPLQESPVLKYARYSTSAADGDVGCDYYDILDLPSNYLTLSKYDEKSGKIEGFFDVHFVIDKTRSKCNPTAPDTIHFTEGVFYTKIQN